MKAMDANLRSETIRWQEKLFQRSVRRQMRWRKLRELLGITSNQHCLEISAGDGIISMKLREAGGAWTTYALNEAARDAIECLAGGTVRVLDGAALPEEDGTFDAVTVVDALERIRDDHAFIKECHRVLKPDGRLIVTAARKPLFCAGGCPLRTLLGLSWRKRGEVRPGYSAHEFFDVLKDGFDVPETDTYATACVEIPGLLCEAAANRIANGPYNMPSAEPDSEVFYRYSRLCTLAALVYPFLWLSARLETLFCWILPGHNLAAKTKRRVWRERRTPVLLDGRSIAEAALNTKIGTAAPF